MNYIVCADKNFGIGKDNDLVFHLSSDMKYFKNMTDGKTVVMGDMTLLSLPGGNPLKNRNNIVLSLDKDFDGKGAKVCHSLSELFCELEKYNTDDVFVIGGATIYDLLMDYCTYAYITKVDAVSDAEKFIRNIDKEDGWTLIETSEPIEEKGLTFTFNTYKNTAVKNFK